MSFLELVGKRRSLRRYSAQPVARSIIDRCLEAARLAPSACNSQPWSFIIVDEPSLRERLAAVAFSGLYGMNAFAKAAPVLVAVIRERSSLAATTAGQIRGLSYNLIDLGIACEHFVLQAEEDGVGTCWLGWFDEKGVKRVLGLSRRVRLDLLISMGYPAEDMEPRPDPRRKTLDEIRAYR